MSQAVQPTHHVSMQMILFALLGAVLAVAAGFGIAALVLDEPAATTGTTVTVPSHPGGPYPSDTDAQIRELMHRR